MTLTDLISTVQISPQMLGKKLSSTARTSGTLYFCKITCQVTSLLLLRMAQNSLYPKQGQSRQGSVCPLLSTRTGRKTLTKSVQESLSPNLPLPLLQIGYIPPGMGSACSGTHHSGQMFCTRVLYAHQPPGTESS